MTNAIAHNSVTQSMNVMNEVITSSTNQCSTTVNTGVYNIVNGGNSISCDVSSNSTVTVTTDISCLASTSVENQIINNLTQSAKQQAEAINQQFALLSFSEAINVSNSYLTLANQMNTAFYNSCVTEITSNEVNVINCGSSTGLTVDLDYNNTIKDTQNCIFNNSSVTNTANNISQSIAQAARAKITNYISQIIFAIALVVVFAGIALFLILLIMKAGKKSEAPVVESGDKDTTGQGDDVIALAAELTGKSPSQLTTSVPTTSTAAYNPMSFLLK